MEVYNVTGQLVYAMQLNHSKQITLSTSQFSKGIYFVKISDAQKIVTRKLVVE
jgi:hypothetical protein